MEHWIGIPTGLLLGLVTGIITISIISRIAIRNIDLKHAIELYGEILSVPGFWFGGPWVTGQLLANIVWDRILPYYVCSLAMSYIIIVLIPLIKYIRMVVKGIV